MKKRLIALITAAVMILCLAPAAIATQVVTDAHTHTGYTKEIAGFGFEEEKYVVGASITKSADKTYDSTETFYMSVDSMEIVQDDAEHGKVVKFAGNQSGTTSKAYGIGIGKNNVESKPDKVKAEVEIKKDATQAVYLLANGISGNMDYELVLWNWDGAIKFNNDGTRSSEVVNVGKDTWCKITLYFDFDSGIYCTYINDAFTGTYTIPNKITGGIQELYVTGNKANHYVDNWSIMTVPPEFKIEEASPYDGESNVSADTDVEITLSNSLGVSFEETTEHSMVTVASDGNVPTYTASGNDDSITVVFDGDLDSGEEYVITLSKDIEDIYEQKLGTENVQISFTTEVYLSEGDKLAIKTAINGANSVDETEDVLNTEEYKGKMALDSKYYTSNIYNTLYEQKPYDTYETAVAMIMKADSLLAQINSAQSSDYTDIFDESDGDIALYGAQKLEAYRGYSTFKEEINTELKSSAPFADFKALRIAFDAAVKTIEDIHTASIDEHTHSGFTKKIVGFDFEDYDANTVISKSENTSYDSTDTFYMSVDSMQIVEDDAEHGMVVKFAGNQSGSISKAYGIGIGKNNFESTPDLVKAEVEIKKDATQAVYLLANEISGNMDYQLMLWNWDGAIKFNNDGTNSAEVGNVAKDTWCKITVYFDFESGVYCTYINDAFTGTYTIPSKIKEDGGINELYVTGNKANHFLDNWNITTLPPEFKIKETSPYDGESNIRTDTDVEITFSNPLTESFEETTEHRMVTVTSDGNIPTYTASGNDGSITVVFEGDLDYGEEYVITLNKDIEDIYEQKLGTENVQISFTTAVYLSDGEKLAIKTAINGANNADEMADVLNTEEYKEKMGLDSKYYTANVYSTLYEQKPSDGYTYDEAVAMIIKADSLLSQINSAQSSDYTGIFDGADGDIALYGARKLEAYRGYSTFKEEINAELKLSAPFADFKTMRTAFDAAVETIEGLYIKAYDYNRVIYHEDFEEDSMLDSALTYKTDDANSVTLTSNIAGTTSIKQHGRVAKLAKNNSTIDNYFRILYGDSSYPVQSKCTVDELSQVQLSMELCPMNYIRADIICYDKYSVSTTATDSVINLYENGEIGFLNSGKRLSYETGKWLCIDVFLDFGTDTYTVYINNELAVEDISLTKLKTCAESIGIVVGATKTASSYSILVDNLRIAIPQKFEMKPAQFSTNVNPADSVKAEFSNELPKNIDAGTVEVTSSGNVPTFTVEKDGNSAVISFNEPLDFGTPYTVTFKQQFCDIYGQSLEEDKVVTFTTIAPQLTASVPQFEDKVRSTAVNPTESTKTAVLVVVKPDCTVVYDEKPITAGGSAPLEVDFDASSLSGEQSAYAFVVDNIATFNLIREIYVSPKQTYAGSTGAATVSLEGILNGTVVNISGKLNSKTKKNIIIRLANSNNIPKIAVPMQTDDNGEFACSMSVEGFDYGTYNVFVTGYNLSDEQSAKIVYLTDIEKEQIKTAINGANSAAQMEAVLKSDEYKEKLNLAQKYYNSNVYTTLYEQSDFETYDKAIEMIYKAERVREDINDADWSGYTAILTENASIMLKGSAQASAYKSYSDNQKNEINKIIVESSPFNSFTALRTALDAAVIKYTASLSDDDGGGSGGGGGGGGGATYNIGTQTVLPVTPSVTPTLFNDMSQAQWAQESVNRLHKMGIVSAAQNYRPFDNVKREEFVKMLVELAGISIEGKVSTFGDVNGSEWYASYLGAAQEAGIIKGSDNGSFGVGASITRQDMVVMALRAVEVMNKSLRQKSTAQTFSDSGEISEYAQEAVVKMQSAGVVSGMGNGCFEPMGLANRAQAAVIICNLIDALE